MNCYCCCGLSSDVLRCCCYCCCVRGGCCSTERSFRCGCLGCPATDVRLQEQIPAGHTMDGPYCLDGLNRQDGWHCHTRGSEDGCRPCHCRRTVRADGLLRGGCIPNDRHHREVVLPVPIRDASHSPIPMRERPMTNPSSNPRRGPRMGRIPTTSRTKDRIPSRNSSRDCRSAIAMTGGSSMPNCPMG